jgi:adenylyltransferase/sulfurtransferase
LGEEAQEVLWASKVLVAGLGGLGSGVVASLAGLGVGNFIFLDNDVVELTNLNRQFIHRKCDIGVQKVESAKRWLSEFSPEASAETLSMRLNSADDIDLRGANAIIDCFDNIESTLILNDLALKFGVPFVHAGVDGLCGQVMSIIPTQTACLKCFLSQSKNENTGTPTSLAPAVNMIASIQSAEVMKILLGQKPTVGKLLQVNLEKMSLKSVDIPRNLNCCP